MPASAEQRDSPFATSNIKFLKQKHKSQLQGVENLKLNPAPQIHNVLGKKDQIGDEELHRLYPKAIPKSKKKNKTNADATPNTVTPPLLTTLRANGSPSSTNEWATSLPASLNSEAHEQTSRPASTSSRRPSVPPSRLSSTSPPVARPVVGSSTHPRFANQHRAGSRGFEELLSPYSQVGHLPYGRQSSQPHEDQAHFYPGGLPDLNSLVPLPQSGLVPGENGLYVGFDTLSTSGHGPSVAAENILCLGEEGALRVYRVSRKAVDIIGRLEGLSGAVIAAKIFPWTFDSGQVAGNGPYVALILHSPMLPEDDAAESSDVSATPSVDDTENGSEPSHLPNSHPGGIEPFVLQQYQTTVEVFSLSRQKRIATLLTCPPTDVIYTESGDLKPPQPYGDLKLDAYGKFVTIASGTSGEIFVFSHFYDTNASEERQSFRCIGKLWTSTLQRGQISTSKGADATPMHLAEQHASRSEAIYSLNSRWLAVVTPTVDSLSTIKSVPILSSSTSKPPGVSSHTPMPKLASTCVADTPDGDSLVNRVSREVAQQVLKGAHWAAEHGMQAWNSYWYGNSQGDLSSTSARVSDINSAFPPTHGVPSSPLPQNSPGQVALFDLQRLLDAENAKIKNSLVPIASFEVSAGCSFLSFAPNGLILLTISSKGDQQIAWSLLRAQQPNVGLVKDEALLPSVRQVAKFNRLTVASTVDVVWNAPHGTRFAILTERGTIHVHEIPAAAFQWPPFKRSRRRARASFSQQTENDDSSRRSTLSAAMNTINGTGAWMRSLPARPRSMGPSTLMMTPAATASVGGKAVKAGFNKSVSLVSNSANTIYHASDNKLHIGNISNGILPGCMRWLSGRDQGYFAVVVTGTLSIYSVHRTSTNRKGKPPILRARISKRPIEFSLHKISDNRFPPAYTIKVGQRMQGIRDDKESEIHGRWSLRKSARATMPGPGTASQGQTHSGHSWHAMFETESSAPYQPFHTDRRVTICAYDESDSLQAPSAPVTADAEPEVHDHYEHTLNEWKAETLDPWLQKTHHVLPRQDASTKTAAQPWIFGDPIIDHRISKGGAGVATDSLLLDDDEMEQKIHVIEGVDGEQVHVTVIRRAGKEEEEFFEDGCEVVEFADDKG